MIEFKIFKKKLKETYVHVHQRSFEIIGDRRNMSEFFGIRRGREREKKKIKLSLNGLRGIFVLNRNTILF